MTSEIMTKKTALHTNLKAKKKAFRFRTLAFVNVVVLGSLTACSSVPDAVNPAEWYRSTVDMLSSDDSLEENGTQTAQSGSVPGEDDTFPDINSVPTNTKTIGSDDTGSGLIADPNKPEYANSIARQTNDGVAPVSEAPAPAPEIVMETAQADLQSAPPAQPVAPVIAASETISAPTTPPAEPEIATEMTQLAPQAPQASLATLSNPLVIQAGVLPSGETYDQYRTRLMAGLNQQAASYTPSPTSAVINPNVQTPSYNVTSNVTSANYSSDTVLISSTGIRNTGQYTGAQSSGIQMAQGTSRNGFTQITNQNGRPMLSANASRIATVHFSNGSSNLDANDRSVLRKVIALQKQNGGIIQIIGHASSRTRAMDPVRHKMVNFQVSVSRADSIANAMVQLGAQKNNIMIGAVSDTQPLYFEVMPTGEAGNRRAEIYIGS